MDGSWALEATWVAIHFVGLVAAWMARKEASGYRQRIAQHSFFACLALIALITVVGQFLCLTTWPLSAATLGAMIVTAVADFDPRGRQTRTADR
jgi:Flp pilus assembly protein TadB